MVDRSDMPSTPATQGSVAVGQGYDGFISYSSADKELAEALQNGLRAFAKPWYQRRALRIFRDDADLSADSDLWGPIDKAMHSSRYVILLASPDAAASQGVHHELTYWAKHLPAVEMLIGHVAGKLKWDENGVAESTTAIPPDFYDRFRREPLYVDLTWTKDVSALSLRDPRFQDVVAKFAAKLHGKPKDGLVGEDVRQHQNTKRVVTAVIAALVALTVFAGIGFSNASTQRDIAQSRALASEAAEQRSLDPALSRQLSAIAYEISPTEQARSSLLSAASLPPVTRVLGHNGPVLAQAVSQETGIIATGGVDGHVNLRSIDDPSSPDLLASILVSQDIISAVAISNDGSLLVAATGGSLAFWDISDLRSPQLLLALKVGSGRVTTVALDPSTSTLVAGVEDGTLHVYDVSDHRTPRPVGVPLAAHAAGVRSVSFNLAGNLLVSGGVDGLVRIWSVDPAAGLAPTGGAGNAESEIPAVAFSPDGGMVATAGTDMVVRLFRVVGGGFLEPYGQPLVGHMNAVYSVAFSPDGSLIASGSNDNTVRVWNTSTSTTEAVLPHPQSVQATAFLGSKNEIATAGNDGALRVWHLPGQRLHVGSPLVSIVGMDGGSLYAGGLDGRVARLDATDPQHPGSLADLIAAAGPAVQRMALSLDHRLLVVPRTDGSFEVWALTGPAGPVRTAVVPDAHAEGVFTAAFRADGRVLATGGPDRQVRLWSLDELSRPAPIGAPLSGRPGAVFTLAISPDGQTLAAGGGDGTTWLYDISTPEMPKLLGDPLSGHRGSVLGVAFSPDGELLATAGEDGRIWLWDVTDRDRVVNLDRRPPLANPGGSVIAVAFDPAGHLIAGSSDGAVRRWAPDVDVTLAEIELVGHTGPVYGVTVLAEGSVIASASADGTVILWGTDPDDALAAACAGVGDALTEEEWTRYVPDRSYSPPCVED